MPGSSFPFKPTPFAFIDGEVHSRNGFRGSEKKNKEYICRGQGVRRQTKKFKFVELSSSIGNFRSKEHEKFGGVN